jgi:ketosteroid isomerase-like protein
MADEKVELVLDGIRCFEARDMEGLAPLFHPEVELSALEGWPEQGPWSGRDAVIAQFERLAADWSEMRLTPGEVVAQADDWVVMEFRWEVRGAQSGLEAQFDVAGAFRIEDSMMREAHYRWNRREALEAAGLKE